MLAGIQLYYWVLCLAIVVTNWRVATGQRQDSSIGILEAPTCSFGRPRDFARGNDISSTRTSSPEECCEKCEQNSRCRAWAFRTSSSWCWLKDNATPYSTHDRDIWGGTVDRERMAKCTTYGDNYRIQEGNDLESYRVSTANACCGLCGGYNGCKAWVFSSNEKRCYLKSINLLEESPQRRVGYVIGILGSPEQSPQPKFLALVAPSEAGAIVGDGDGGVAVSVQVSVSA